MIFVTVWMSLKASAAGRIGGMLAPLILYTSTYNEFIPPLVISFFCFASAFIATKLRETKNVPLFQSIEEAVKFYRG